MIKKSIFEIFIFVMKEIENAIILLNSKVVAFRKWRFIPYIGLLLGLLCMFLKVQSIIIFVIFVFSVTAFIYRIVQVHAFKKHKQIIYNSLLNISSKISKNDFARLKNEIVSIGKK